MPEFPEIPAVHELAGEDDERREQRFTKAVAIAIVLATLAAAVTAYLQAAALRDHDEASAHATELASAALASRRQADQVGQMLVGRYALALDQRTHAADDLQRAAFGGGGGAGLLADRRRWLEVAALTDRDTRAFAAAYRLPPVRRDGPAAPGTDRFFPERYLATARRAAYELGARRDGANQRAEEANLQIGRYTIALTVFAVAVFLFGYSLTPHGRRRRGLFAGAAAAFVLGGAAWAAATAARHPEEPEPAAAAAFADGRVAFDSERYALAVRRLDATLEAWPEYAAAYALRARAEFAEGSPQLDVPLSLTTLPALRASVADQARALDHGAEDSELVVEHGFQLFALGLRRDDDGPIEKSLRFSDDGARSRPTDPVPVFNRAVALLALGRRGEAAAAYREAVLRTVYADPRRRVRRDDNPAAEGFLAEALTDLQSLAVARPRLRAAVAAAKRAIVAPITRDGYTEPPFGAAARPPASGGLRIGVGPAGTRLRILRPRHIGVRADLSAQWYFEAPGGLGWSVLPDVSGAVNDASLFEDADGSLSRDGGWLGATGSCLAPGRYRLELYVDGRLVAVAQRRATFPALRAKRLLDLGLALCAPAGWRRVAGAPSLLDGARSADGRAGMLVVSVSREVAGAQAPSRALSERIAAAALRRFAGRLPRGLRCGGPGRVAFSPDFVDRVVRACRFPGGRGLLGAGVSADARQLIVAVAYGPPAFMAARGRAIFGSLAQERS